MLLTHEHREQNRVLHEQRDDYGRTVKAWVDTIRELANTVPTRDILDYGCGKRVLEQELGAAFSVRSYDPCIPGFDATPEPTDLVVCVDVLEHIEPDCLDDVLDDLKRVTRKLGFFTVATGPAKKTYPDGRNAHLIQRPYEWWMPKIWSRFRVRQFNDLGKNFMVMVSPLV